MMKKYSNKVVLIGGGGFIGKALNRFFVDIFKWDTKIIDKRDIDLAKEISRERVREMIEIYDPHHIVILAATKRQDGDSNNILELNNRISENISFALSNLNKHVTYFSSCAVYGEKNEQKKVNEDSKILPTSNYGEHKIYSESLYKKTIGFSNRLLIVRPPLIYSESETSGYNPGGFLYSARTNKYVSLWGDGSELREFIHIDDVTNVVSTLMRQEATGVVNLVAGKSYSYREIASLICEIYKAKLISKERTGKIVNHTYNPTKLMHLIGKYTFQSPLEIIRRYEEI